MKKLPVFTFILVLGLFGCSSQKKLGKTAPFNVTGPTFQEFAAGKAEGGSGFTLKIPLEGTLSTLVFEGVYFRGHLMKPSVEEENGKSSLVCEFWYEIPAEEKRFVMHADPMEEVGNQPPALLKEKDEFPFELQPDEAVIAYKEQGKRKVSFFKIGGIKEKAPLMYPSRPQN